MPGRAARAGASPESDVEPQLDADPEAVARLICLRLLTAAPRTRAELADALKHRGVPADAADSVLSRFTEVGLIDDSMFAAMWVESRHRGRGLGRRALVAELDRRGVAKDDITAAVDQLTPDVERETALALVERRLGSIAGQPRQVQVRKLAGLLARKGYSPGLSYSVVREALHRAGEDAGDLADEDDFAVEDPD